MDFVRPKPWHLKKWRRRLPSLIFIPIALGIIAVAGTVGDQDGRIGKTQPRAAPRSLNGGNAWNRIGGGFAGSASQTLTGTVTYIRDGDTFVVGTTPVRIANLDCAESGTLTGDMATRRASQLVNGKTVTCRLNTQTSYDRVIGKCSLADGRDFGRVMASETGCSLN
ncbi:thermonuclease family protein [Roseovarius sp. S1116L3]|uniref:thermonuclease family protein n=1 Tax=Roseovarius roseus TaxID=3342636 RepID=UPI00372CC376